MSALNPLSRKMHSADKLRGLAPLSNRRFRWLLFLLLAGLITLASWMTYVLWPAQSVDEVRLVGHRSPTPISLILVVDESGSFQEYDQIRSQTFESIMTWSQANLRPDDSITVIAFAGSAELKMKTTTVSDIAEGWNSLDTGTLGGGSSIQPALELAMEQTPKSIPQSLVVLTDTLIDDLDANQIDAFVRNLNVTSMSLIVPEKLSINSEWKRSFPYEFVVRAAVDSSDQGALAIAKAAAHATGQTLEKTP